MSEAKSKESALKKQELLKLKAAETTAKKVSSMARGVSSLNDVTVDSGGFLAKLSRRTEGVPFFGSMFKGLNENVQGFKKGIDATGRMIGLGNKDAAAILGISRKQLGAANKARKDDLNNRKLAEENFKELGAELGVDLEKLANENGVELSKLSMASKEDRKSLLAELARGNEVNKEYYKKMEEDGDEAMRKEDERHQENLTREDTEQMSMRERMGEMFSKFKDQVGAAKGIGGKASAIMKSGGEMVKNMFGEMFGSLAATFVLGPVKKLVSKLAASWLGKLVMRGFAMMSPPVLIAMAVVGLLAFFSKDIIKWFKKMWSAISGYFANINWKKMFKTVLKVIFLPHILIFKLGKKIWGAITGFFDGFSLEDMMSKLGDISIVKYIMDLKDKIVNGLKSFILNIVPETFFKYPLRKKVAEMMGVTLSGGGQVDSTEAATSSTSPFVDKSDVVDANFANTLNENALAKTGSKGATNIVTSKGGDQVVTNQNVTHTSTSIGNPDPVYGKFLYGV